MVMVNQVRCIYSIMYWLPNDFIYILDLILCFSKDKA